MPRGHILLFLLFVDRCCPINEHIFEFLYCGLYFEAVICIHENTGLCSSYLLSCEFDGVMLSLYISNHCTAMKQKKFPQKGFRVSRLVYIVSSAMSLYYILYVDCIPNEGSDGKVSVTIAIMIFP